MLVLGAQVVAEPGAKVPGHGRTQHRHGQQHGAHQQQHQLVDERQAQAARFDERHGAQIVTVGSQAIAEAVSTMSPRWLRACGPS
jgi:hypothetical protein